MNVNYSTTEHKNSEKLTDFELSLRWVLIDWKKVEQEVNRLQVRIAKASINEKQNEVKRLQYLLTHSFYAKLLAVKKITTNKGKNTSGIDGKLWSTPATKMKAVLGITDKGYKAKPLKRVYIEKKGKKEKRPLGIPTMYDRAMQALYALALDPVSESTADNKSFGFRKARSCQDACEYIFTALSHNSSAKYILEGDIKGCFDNISHDWLIENIPMDKPILRQFLKAGFIFNHELFPTEDGTPQGGVISPIFANMALDGMQLALDKEFNINKHGEVVSYKKLGFKVNLIRYADDFVITAIDEEVAQRAKKAIKEFLVTRGLELSENKTKISHIDDGFDFLGWNFRKYNGKLIVKPSKKSIDSFVRSLSDTILKRGKAWKQEVLIQKLNQQLRGWANYHQSVAASETYSHIDFVLFNLLYRWAKRRHPKKGKWFVTTKYWRRISNRSWVFATDDTALLRVDHIPIVRHIKVQMNANPYIDVEYFAERKFKQGMRRLSGRFKNVWKNQDGRCFHCGMPLEVMEERQIYFKTPKSEGGQEIVTNMAYVHKSCNALNK